MEERFNKAMERISYYAQFIICVFGVLCFGFQTIRAIAMGVGIFYVVMLTAITAILAMGIHITYDDLVDYRRRRKEGEE